MLVSRDFGFISAAVLSLLLALPLVVAARLRGRWPAVRGRELLFLAILFCVATGGGAFVVRAWYADALDRDHAEDMRWAEFERRLRRDPAFRHGEVHESKRKNIHMTAHDMIGLDAATGKPLWHYEAGARIVVSPGPERRTVYFGCDDGYPDAGGGE